VEAWPLGGDGGVVILLLTAFAATSTLIELDQCAGRHRLASLLRAAFARFKRDA